MKPLSKQIPFKARSVDDEKRILRFVGSTGDIDRDGEIIDPAGWELKSFLRNPVIQFGHDYGERPVARAVGIEAGPKGLVFDVQFPTEEQAGDWYGFSDSVYRLAKSGFLNTTSVGFRPLAPPENVKDGDGIEKPFRIWRRQELLELSIVPVPSNPQALAAGFAEGVVKSADLAALDRIIKHETRDAKNVDWANDVCRVIEAADAITDCDTEGEDMDEVTERLDQIEAMLCGIEDRLEVIARAARTLQADEVAILNAKHALEHVLNIQSKDVEAAGSPEPDDDINAWVEAKLAGLKGK